MLTFTKDAQEALLWVKDGYPGHGYEFRKWELDAAREITYSFVSKNDKEMVDALKAAIKAAPYWNEETRAAVSEGLDWSTAMAGTQKTAIKSVLGYISARQTIDAGDKTKWAVCLGVAGTKEA